MKYSVIIPALNEERNIGNCIKKVKEQISKDTEIIVVDGYSKDRTVEIAENLGAKVLFEKKPTISAGRDTGLRNAKGEIVLFVDSDVMPSDLWFEKITKPFLDKAVVAVGGMTYPNGDGLIDNAGMRLVFAFIAPILFKFQIPLVTGANMALRKKEALEVGSFIREQIHGEDTSIFLRIKKKGKIVHSRAIVLVSTRRIKNWGLCKYLSFNIRNYVSLLKYGKPIKDGYEPIREKE